MSDQPLPADKEQEMRFGHLSIAHNLEDYEALAVRLAHNPGELEAITKELAGNRVTEPLFDTPRFARNLEKAYNEMWKIHLAGQGAQKIEIVEG